MASHLVIFSAYYPPFTGGYAKSTVALAERIAARGWQVTVFTCLTHGGEKEETMSGVQVIRVPAWNLLGTFPIPKPTLFFLRAFYGLFRKPVTIVSTQTRFFATSGLGLKFAILRRKPLVHTERGSVHTEIENPLIRAISIIVDHTLGWAIARYAKKSVGVSGAASEFMHHLGAKEPVTIPNGIDAKQFDVARESASVPHQDMGITRIIFVGRLIWAKGVQDLITAVSMLNEQERARVKVQIIGEGLYRNKLEEQVLKLHLTPQFAFLGAHPASAIPALLARADIFVNPSYSEGLPRSVLEAGAAGKAVIATDVGGTEEIIEDGVSGILLPPKSPEALRGALTRLLDDEELRKRMGNAAKNYVRSNFDWDRIADKYVALFEHVMAVKKQRG